MCQGQRVSVAVAGVNDLAVWRDVRGACRQILGGFDGVYAYPPAMGSVVIRAAETGGAGIDVDRVRAVE